MSRRRARAPEFDHRQCAQRAARRQYRLYRPSGQRRCDRVHGPRTRPDRRRAPGAGQDRSGPDRRRSPRPGRARCVQRRRDRANNANWPSISRSRSSAAASTRPGPRSRPSSGKAQDRILVQLPGIDDPEHVKALLGRTAKLTFQLVDTGASVDEARSGRLPLGDEVLPAEEGKAARVGPDAYVVQQAGHGRRRHPGRCAADLPGQRAGGQLPLRCRGRAGALPTRPARMSASPSRSCSTTR